jgi:hypothetical protein
MIMVNFVARSEIGAVILVRDMNIENYSGAADPSMRLILR